MRNPSIPLVALALALAMQSAALAQGLAGDARVSSLSDMLSIGGLQPYGYYVPIPDYYRYRASTAAEGYARGLAAVIQAQGQYNRLSAEARLVHAEAARQEIANRELATQTYFAMRRENAAARAAERGPRATQEELLELAAQARPDRLSPNELNEAGQIAWPILLQADEFAAYRAELENAFTQRAAQGGIGLAEQTTADQATKAMLEMLKSMVRDVRPADYTAARSFIESLAFEVRLPLS